MFLKRAYNIIFSIEDIDHCVILDKVVVNSFDKNLPLHILRI